MRAIYIIISNHFYGSRLAGQKHERFKCRKNETINKYSKLTTPGTNYKWFRVTSTYANVATHKITQEKCHQIWKKIPAN